MKVLVIWRLLTVGGVNAGWRNRAVELKKHGISTEFLYYKDLGGMHIMEDVAPVYLTKDKEKIVNIIKQNNYDLIIVVDTPKAYKWLKEANYTGPVIIEARTPEIIKLQKNLSGYESVSPVKMIVPSEHQKRVLSILVNKENTPIDVIYNGTDISFFKPVPNREINLEEEPILPPDKKIVTYIGRLDKRKNWRLLLKIADKIKQKREDIEFWIVGGANSVERDKFEECLKQNNLGDIVKWYPVIPYQQMPHMYAKIRKSRGCTIATTRAESFGNTFIESMACGVPVVAPKISSIPEIVRHGETGFMFHEEDVEDAVKQIEQIVDKTNPSYSILSELSRNQVEKHFSISKITKDYANVLQEVVKRADSE